VAPCGIIPPDDQLSLEESLGDDLQAGISRKTAISRGSMKRTP
jgi:hypothetical protein